MAKQIAQATKLVKNTNKRPNVHSKNSNSSLKSSKNYKKKYRGQGR